MTRAAAIAVAILAGALIVPGSTQAAQATQVSAGLVHTCALTVAGGVKCWGWNYYGQLGDTTNRQRIRPIDVTGLASGIAQISAGDLHTCALTTAGGVKCWGLNFDGQLGDGTYHDRRRPVDVIGLASGITQIAAGGSQTCALTAAGDVKCWGDDSTTPFDMTDLPSGVAQITAGDGHICVLTDTGGAKCWGSNDKGQLGDGTTTDSYDAVDVTGLASGVIQISAGDSHTCAITAPGDAKCWGNNEEGQLGDNTTTERHTPVDVIGLAGGVAQISAGDDHTCAVTVTDGAKCWGLNYYGQLGDRTTRRRLRPVGVAGLTDGVIQISAGYEHTCALVIAGKLMCWGDSLDGQLGDNSETGIARLAPVFVQGFGGRRTTTTLAPRRRASYLNERVIFTARVRPMPTGGRMFFTDNGIYIHGCWPRGVPVIHGFARCATRLDYYGRHRIRAYYLGGAVFKPSSSVSLIVVVH